MSGIADDPLAKGMVHSGGGRLFDGLNERFCNKMLPSTIPGLKINYQVWLQISRLLLTPSINRGKWEESLVTPFSARTAGVAWGCHVHKRGASCASF